MRLASPALSILGVLALASLACGLGGCGDDDGGGATTPYGANTPYGADTPYAAGGGAKSGLSADLAKVIRPENVKDGGEDAVLNSFDCRQALHVTYGSALDRFKERLLDVLDRHEEVHYGTLQAHLSRHVAPFA